LTSCDQCERDVNELCAFKDLVSPEFHREYKPSLKGDSAENHGHRWVAVLVSLWQKFPVRVFGSALAASLLAVTSWFGWRELQKIKPNPKITVTDPSPIVHPTILSSPAPEFFAARAIVQLYDGEGQITLDQKGKLSGVDHLPPAYRQMVKRALINQKLERSQFLAGLILPRRIPRNGADDRNGAFSVIEPVGEVTLSNHPTFRWSRLNGATTYIVEVYDEQFSLIATSPQIIDHSWTAPQPLQRGNVYSWLVKAVKDGQTFVAPRSPAPQAKFRIMDQAKANELAWARRTFTSSHLTLGLLYVQTGLVDEAERELRALQKANPNSSIVRQLLAQVQALRRL